VAALEPEGPRPVRRAASPWELGGLSVRELARRVYLRVWDDEILDRAAGLSYYFSFALFPTLLFLTALLGLLPLPDLMGQLMDYADRMLPQDAASLLRKTLEEVVSGASGGLLSVGVFAALWAASSGMLSLMTALNVAYRVRDARRWWKARLVAIALTIGFSLFTLTAHLLLVFGGGIGEKLAMRTATQGATAAQPSPNAVRFGRAAGRAIGAAVGSDLVVPLDYDGDGRTDLAVYRPATGVWYVLTSSSGYTTFFTRQWGLATDVPILRR